MLVLRLAALYLTVVVLTAEDSCVKQTCQCQFSKEGVGGESPKSQSAKKSEILAAAAGVMSPLLIGGAGLGIFKLIKNRGSNNVGGSVSSLSESSEGQPPSYRPQSRKNNQWNF